MRSHQICLFGELSKIMLASKLLSAALWAPLYKCTGTRTQASHTHLPWWKGLQPTHFTFHFPQTKRMKRASYRRLNDMWRKDHVLNTHCTLTQAFCLTLPQIPYFPKQPEVKPLKDVKENPWKELTPNDQSGLFPHVDKPLVNRCFLSSHLAVWAEMINAAMHPNRLQCSLGRKTGKIMAKEGWWWGLEFRFGW